MIMSGKDFLKSHVLSWRRKVYSDWDVSYTFRHGWALQVFGKGKKGRHSSSCEPHLRATGRHLPYITCVVLCCVTCHPTQVNAPRLTQAMQADTRFTYPRGMGCPATAPPRHLWQQMHMVRKKGARLMIERSLVRLLAGALSSQLGQLSLPSLR